VAAEVEGQVAVANSAGIRHVELVPRDARADPAAVAAIVAADQVVLAPGSLYTSVLPVLCVAELCAAVEHARGQVVQVANLRSQPPETSGLGAADHLRAVREHGGRVDVFLYQEPGTFPVEPDAIVALGARPVGADVAGADGLHDVRRLALALQALL
jgi:uncharacterized cofD-like protein